nr:MAG TPA: hypothetical protein [Caudoviricetes sp.]
MAACTRDIALDPYAMMDDAFTPFTREVLVFHLQDGTNMTANGSVFADAEIDPLTDGAMDSDIEQVSIHLPSSSWHSVQKIVRGDTVERPVYNKRYRVSKVSNDMIGIIITARRDG